MRKDRTWAEGKGDIKEKKRERETVRKVTKKD